MSDDNFRTLAEMPADEMTAKLNEVEPQDDTFQTEDSVKSILSYPAWKYQSHAYGYLPPVDGAADTQLDIIPVGLQSADTTLQKTRVNITLDQIHIAKYPGWGERTILFNFAAVNSADDKPEQLHFNQTYQAQNGQLIGLRNVPIFIGLQVGASGVHFKCTTINVKNNRDEQLLTALNSEMAGKGLELATTAQPAIAPFAAVALGLAKHIAQRNRNVPVQRVELGLDFGNNPVGARLNIGSYVVVQCDDDWDWSRWKFDRAKGRMVNAADVALPIPFNYFVFGVSRH